MVLDFYDSSFDGFKPIYIYYQTEVQTRLSTDIRRKRRL